MGSDEQKLGNIHCWITQTWDCRGILTSSLERSGRLSLRPMYRYLGWFKQELLTLFNQARLPGSSRKAAIDQQCYLLILVHQTLNSFNPQDSLPHLPTPMLFQKPVDIELCPCNPTTLREESSSFGFPCIFNLVTPFLPGHPCFFFLPAFSDQATSNHILSASLSGTQTLKQKCLNQTEGWAAEEGRMWNG